MESVFIAFWIILMITHVRKTSSAIDDLMYEAEEESKKLLSKHEYFSFPSEDDSEKIASDYYFNYKVDGRKEKFAIFQYDMLLQEEQYNTIMRHSRRRSRRIAVKDPARLWTNRIIPYTIDHSFNTAEKLCIEKAIGMWMRWTCLNFVLAKNNEYDRVKFTATTEGCGKSNVGMLSGEQYIFLSPRHNCSTNVRVVAHEIGHAIGLLHEQMRYDRDEYITVNNDNIIDNREARRMFNKMREDEYQDFSKPYDYLSIMHYGKLFYSRNRTANLVTLSPKNTSYLDIIGDVQVLSYYDVKSVCELYKCSDICKSTCSGAGFMGSKCQCICSGPSDDNPVRHCAMKGSCFRPPVDYSKYAVLNKQSFKHIPKKSGTFINGTTFQIEWNDTDACGYDFTTYQCQNGTWIGDLPECHPGCVLMNWNTQCIVCDNAIISSESGVADHNETCDRLDNYDHGDNISLSCKSNLTMMVTSQCNNGDWTTYSLNCSDGQFCDIDVDECALQSDICKNGGTCKNRPGAYLCVCVNGWTGQNCDVNIDDCLDNPCYSNGTCFDRIGYYHCECPHGKTGLRCHLEDACMSNPCKGEGSLCETSPIDGNPICFCKGGWTGNDCGSDINECQEGRHCEVDVNECNQCHGSGASCPCENGACQNTHGSYNCVCNSGYDGKHCELDHDDCVPNRCQNGGTCIDNIGDFSCRCPRGFTGFDCRYDLDECLSNPCRNGAECKDYVDSYTCTCRPGFSGVNCGHNDNDCTHSSCLNNGQCIDGVNSYRCECARSYTGGNCEHLINPCDANQCMNGAVCINFDDNGHYCICPIGFIGPRCEAFVDMCTAGVCMNRGTCTQVADDYRCECLPGYTGRVCDVRMVSCDVAASLSGVSVSELCQNGGICRDTGNTHRCVCASGYQGSYCDSYIDYCAAMPCANGANCTNNGQTYQCGCAHGYMGVNCDVNIDDCARSPCANGGTCHDLIGKFICSCPPGTSGYLCDINKNDCYSGACHYGGSCVDEVGGFSCTCPSGYVGPRCEGDINECLSNPCSPTGMLSCEQLLNDYKCHCKTGYTGRHCINFCAESPCQNLGMCRNTESGPECKCTHMYTGMLCEKLATVCDDVRCQSGGKCQVTGNSFQCNCPYGWTGTLCERNIDEFASNPCQNNGQCIDKQVTEGACKEGQCPKFQVCMINMQGIPICACPSAFVCNRRRSRREKKGMEEGTLCGTDGQTYETRCHMRIANCNSEKRIKRKHIGACPEDDSVKHVGLTLNAKQIEREIKMEEERELAREKFRLKNERITRRNIKRQKMKERRKTKEKRDRKERERTKRKNRRSKLKKK